MAHPFSRRHFLAAGTGSLLVSAGSWAADAPASLPQPITPLDRRSRVSLIHGEDRRKNVYESLKAIDDLIVPVLRKRKYVVIKPNNVSTVNQLAATHADALRGILDYVTDRFRGPVVIAESSAGDTMQGFEAFRYTRLPGEYKSRKIDLIDLNKEAKYEVVSVLDSDLHPTPVRLAARLLDPEAFVISAGCLKTHNVVVATLGIKNMTMGAPLHQAPGETKRWNDKRKYHGGVRQTHYDLMVTAQRMWNTMNLDVIDGYEGMEGNGPSSGTPVRSRIAIASTDFVAADRVGVETMGVDPGYPGYLLYCWNAGLGQYDLNKLDIIGENLASVRKPYRLHGDIDRELQWRGPMEEVSPKLG
jgi:uncharacterized protein (DUF362 family)